MNRFPPSIAAAAVAALTFGLSAPSFAAPETYKLDGGHSMPRFEYTHMGYSTQLQRFDKASGTITIDRAAKTGSVDVSIDANSIDTGFELFNGHLKGEDFFSVEKFPTITFKSDSMKFDGDKPASIDGTLTVKGVSKPVTLTVTSFYCAPHPAFKKDACGGVAVTKVKRSEFNMGRAVPLVGDEVTLTLPVEAIKQ